MIEKNKKKGKFEEGSNRRKSPTKTHVGFLIRSQENPNTAKIEEKSDSNSLHCPDKLFIVHKITRKMPQNH
jgi:hypothetical protein